MKKFLMVAALLAFAVCAKADVIVNRVTVASSAIRLDTNPKNELITVVNQGSGSVYLGGNNAVLTSTGFELASKAALSIILSNNEQLWGISAGSYRVDVMETGR